MGCERGVGIAAERIGFDVVDAPHAADNDQLCARRCPTVHSDATVGLHAVISSCQSALPPTVGSPHSGGNRTSLSAPADDQDPQPASWSNSKRSPFDSNSFADSGSDPFVSQVQAGSNALLSISAFHCVGLSLGSTQSRPRVSWAMATCTPGS